ncbi:pre-mRNA-splicing factor CWC25 homolog isoform X2 [Setaria italica]|uniref:pre-mRNA-splicing factor CWC25 homolog isoform X2 n=1 Tax=Setaria italica TaxID=4555 RepID=UPI0006490763|nr:pre-mRNA-splicing factor CWC25 homolog isoform X2 [Setaria italica]
MALKFLNKKGWHTGSLRNIERVWKAEQAEEAEKRKTEELKKQVAAEKEKAEFRAMQERAGLRPAQERLDFLYESGLAVGKSSEGFQALQQSAPGAAAASSSSAQASAADSSKAATPGALFEDKPQSANDTWRKLHSDPLLLIRQREQDAIARIKNNPIKMAEIKKSVESEKKQKEEKKEKKKHKHRHHKSKSKRHHSDEDSDLDEISDGKDERRKRVHSSPDRKKEEKRSRHEKKHRRQDSSDSDNDEKQRRRQDVSEDDEPRRRRHDDDEPRRKRHDDDEPRRRHDDNEPRRRRQSDDEPRRRRQSDDEPRRRQEDLEPRRRWQDDEEPRGRWHDDHPRYDRLDADDRKRRQHSPPDRHHAYSKYDGPDPRPKRMEDGNKTGNSNSEHHSRAVQGSGEQTRQESEHGRNNGPPFNRRRGGVHHMSEEERLARLRQMQADAEVHEEQRWKRLKKAADDDAKEAATVSANQFKGKNFLEEEKKSIFGTEKGGSATIEESIRRRAFYSQGGRDAEGNAFRR